MARGVRVVGSNIVHGVCVGILSVLLNLIDWLQNQFEELGIGVQKDRVSGEDDVHSVHVAIGRDLLHEDVGVLGRAGQLHGSKDLTDREGGDCQVVLASGINGILGYPVIEILR